MSEHILVVRHLSKQEVKTLERVIEALDDGNNFKYACISIYDVDNPDHFVQPNKLLVLDL